MTISWSTAVPLEGPDFGRNTKPTSIVHAWDNRAGRTACGKPGEGMRTGSGDWTQTFVGRCPDCANRTT